MEASTRIFKSSNHHFSNLILPKWHHPLKFSTNPLLPPTSRHIPFPLLSISSKVSQSKPYCYQSHPPNWNPLLLFRSLSLYQSQTFNSLISSDRFARILSGPKDKSFEWKSAPAGVNGGVIGFTGDKAPIVTVVLLGWLGSKQKHLRRYAELYNSRGIHALTFAASVKDVLSFDLGRRLEERISALASELAGWLSERENDGRERFLLFHTFSNTGCFVYGSILNKLQGRQDLLEKIKGCVVDSGGVPDINPKVWAAGFTAALLKKRSSTTHSSFEAGEGKEVESGAIVIRMGDKEPLFIEVFLLTVFEKFFSYILNFPDVNERLMKIITTLSKDQPPYPQLYLYSTADKVIPFQSIESFVEDQREMGRRVTTYNFGSTPHVDHYRTFPDMYQSLLQNFLEECLAMG